MAKLTEMPHPVSDRIMTGNPSDKGPECYNSTTMANPEVNKETFYSQLNGTLRLQKHPQYRQTPADRRHQCKDRKRK